MAKLVGYAEASGGGQWIQEALLVDDRKDGFDFAAASEEVATSLHWEVSASIPTDATPLKTHIGCPLHPT